VQAAQLHPVGGGGAPRSRAHKRRLLQPVCCIGGAAAQYAGGPAAHRRLCAQAKFGKVFFRFAGWFPFLALHLRYRATVPAAPQPDSDCTPQAGTIHVMIPDLRFGLRSKASKSALHP